MKKISKPLCSIIIFIIIVSYNLTIFANNELNIDANAVLIVETNTGKIIYEKDSTEKNYPASVTKILTAILVIENCNLDDIVTVSQTAISNMPEGYVVAPLFNGEQMKVEDLLYALMLKSANDAAYVLAEHVGGSVEGFSKMMNSKAEEIGCKNSHFVNPNGIHNPEHYTTAYDMYLISNYAMKNEEFAKIVSTYKHTLPATNKYHQKDRIMENTNAFVNPNSSFYNKEVNGIKTGTTIQAGNCLITSFSKDGLNFISVLLGAKTSDSKFTETKKMINYSFNNYQLTQLHKKGEKITNVEVKKAKKEAKNLELVTSDEINVLKNVNLNLDNIEPQIELNTDITAPIYEGQELGVVKYNIDKIDYETKLVASNDVEKKTYYIEILIIGGMLLIFVIILVAKRKNRK